MKWPFKKRRQERLIQNEQTATIGPDRHEITCSCGSVFVGEFPPRVFCRNPFGLTVVLIDVNTATCPNCGIVYLPLLLSNIELTGTWQPIVGAQKTENKPAESTNLYFEPTNPDKVQ